MNENYNSNFETANNVDDVYGDASDEINVDNLNINKEDLDGMSIDELLDLKFKIGDTLNDINEALKESSDASNQY